MGAPPERVVTTVGPLPLHIQTLFCLFKLSSSISTSFTRVLLQFILPYPNTRISHFSSLFLKLFQNNMLLSLNFLHSFVPNSSSTYILLYLTNNFTFLFQDLYSVLQSSSSSSSNSVIHIPSQHFLICFHFPHIYFFLYHLSIMDFPFSYPCVLYTQPLLLPLESPL